MEQEWGSMFYKHIGNHTRAEAKRLCSAYGDSVHLPIPRFEDEDKFYRNHFRNETLWLDISRTSYGNYNSPHGQLFAKPVNLWTHSGFKYVILTEDGEWQTTDELNQRDSVCVLNIPPHDNCFNCYDKAFCRFTKQSRQETECVCPIDREGKFCDILKNGKIRLNKQRGEGCLLDRKKTVKDVKSCVRLFLCVGIYLDSIEKKLINQN